MMRMRFCFWAMCFFAVWFIGTPALAVINIVGDVDPTYPGIDPWEVGGSLYVANIGTFGSMSIDGGSDVFNMDGHIAYGPGTTGEVLVDGVDSTWINSGVLDVGSQGHGALTVQKGGFVFSTHGILGSDTDGVGVATIRGDGSSWVNNGSLYIGQSGRGALKIADGGVVSAASVTINPTSILSIEGTDGSQLNIEPTNSVITNNGTIRVIARAAAMSDTVSTPIQAADWMGSGVCEAIGGRWDDVSHEFTVSNVEHGLSGTPVSINLATEQRVAFDDPTSEWSVGASFYAYDNSTPMDFTATVSSQSDLDELENLLEHNEVVRSAWEFETDFGGSSSIPGDLAYLSFDVGSGFIPGTMTVWHHDVSGWTEYEAPDFLYDGRYVSFAVSGFSGYGVTAMAIPGDANGDGDVDDLDAAELATNWGLEGDWAEGDFDGDGTVGPSDASIMAGNWSFGSFESASVPEPSVILILLAGMMMLLVRHRR